MFSCDRHGSSSAEKWTSVGPWTEEEAEVAVEERETGSMPSDAALGQAVRVMFKGADLGSKSMKDVLADLEARFGVALTAKKNVVERFVDQTMM
jgi:hypothetical protein